MEMPDELGPIGRLHAPPQATDPDRFVVATVPGDGGRAGRRLRLGGRARTALVPVDAVRPARGPGAGPRPGPARATPARPPSTDGLAGDGRSTASSRSRTALYAGYGIVPRMPILDLRGELSRPEAFPALPSGIVSIPFEPIAAGPPGGPATRARRRPSTRSTASCSASPTRSTTASCAREDRLRLPVPRTGRRRRSATATPARSAGSARSPSATTRCSTADRRPPRRRGRRRAAAGRLGVSGGAPRLVPTLLAAGLRIDGFPVLLCWDRPFADFDRYLPISPGLL